MAKQSKTHTPSKTPSALDKFALSFEYNIGWNEANQTIQVRSTKK